MIWIVPHEGVLVPMRFRQDPSPLGIGVLFYPVGGFAMMKRFVSPIRLSAVLLATAAVCAAQAPAANLASTWRAAATVADATKPANPPGFEQRSPRYRVQAGEAFALTFDLGPRFNQLAV